jgi:hypothetical protein
VLNEYSDERPIPEYSNYKYDGEKDRDNIGFWAHRVRNVFKGCIISIILGFIPIRIILRRSGGRVVDVIHIEKWWQRCKGNFRRIPNPQIEIRP